MRQRVGIVFQDPDDQLFMPTVHDDVAFGPANFELGAPDPEVGGTEGDVVADRRHEQLVIGILEDDADALADFAQVRLGDREPADPDLAGAATEDAVEVEDERGLAGAVRAEESDPFALVDGEVDSEERTVAIGVREGDAATSSAGTSSAGMLTPTPTRWRR